MARTSTIQAVSGDYIHLIELERNSYRIQDIAHALSHVCRFSGHTRRFYSVAQHSVLTSLVNPRLSPYEKLMHDAHEFAVGDVTTPLKRELPSYRVIEDRFSDSIASAFVLDRGFADLPEVKRADYVMLLTEKRDLMKKAAQDQQEWAWIYALGLQPLKKRVKPWPPLRAKHEFLARFYELCPTRFLNMPRRLHVWWHKTLALICG